MSQGLRTGHRGSPAKAGISQPTASRHLDVLRRAGLIRTTRVAGFNLHRSDEEGLAKAKEALNRASCELEALGWSSRPA